MDAGLSRAGGDLVSKSNPDGGRTTHPLDEPPRGLPASAGLGRSRCTLSPGPSPGAAVAYRPDPDATTATEAPDTDHDRIVRVYRFMYARVGNRSDAEDLTTAVFDRVASHLRISRTRNDVDCVLFRAATGVLTDFWQRRFGTPFPGGGDESPDALSRDPDARRCHVSRILHALPTDLRSVLELRFVAGCSIDEAARRMRITVGAARALQYRALGRVAELTREVTRPGPHPGATPCG